VPSEVAGEFPNATRFNGSCRQANLEPAASAVPASSAEDNQQDDDDKKRRAIHATSRNQSSPMSASEPAITVRIERPKLSADESAGTPCAPPADASRILRAATFNSFVLPNFGLVAFNPAALDRGQRLRSRRDRPDGLERIDWWQRSLGVDLTRCYGSTRHWVQRTSLWASDRQCGNRDS